MATPAIIAVTPGIGINLDAVSLTVGPNTVVRETMVIADPNVAGNLVTVTSGGALTVTDPVLDLCVTANVLAVFLPTATVSTLTPPTAAAIAAAIVANPPAVTFTGGTITAVTSITNPVTVQQATAANLKATVSGTGVFIVQDSVLDACVTANIVAVSLPTATVITLTPPTAAAIAAAIVANPPAVTVTGSVGVTQSTTPWIVAGGGTAGSPGTAVLTIQGISGGQAVPVSGTFYQATQPISIASGAIAAGAAAAGAFADGSVYVRSNAAATFPVTATIAAAQKIEVYDGTNTATVKAASTAAVATDTAVVVTEPGSTTAGACANTAVTSTSSDILAANTARREAVIVNTDVVVVFIGLGQTPTATAYHVALKPCTVAHDGTGGSFVTDTWKGQINAITASTSGHVAVTELT